MIYKIKKHELKSIMNDLSREFGICVTKDTTVFTNMTKYNIKFLYINYNIVKKYLDGSEETISLSNEIRYELIYTDNDELGYLNLSEGTEDNFGLISNYFNKIMPTQKKD